MNIKDTINDDLGELSLINNRAKTDNTDGSNIKVFNEYHKDFKAFLKKLEKTNNPLVPLLKNVLDTKVGTKTYDVAITKLAYATISKADQELALDIANCHEHIKKNHGSLASINKSMRHLYNMSNSLGNYNDDVEMACSDLIEELDSSTGGLLIIMPLSNFMDIDKSVSAKAKKEDLMGIGMKGDTDTGVVLSNPKLANHQLSLFENMLLFGVNGTAVNVFPVLKKISKPKVAE